MLVFITFSFYVIMNAGRHVSATHAGMSGTRKFFKPTAPKLRKNLRPAKHQDRHFVTLKHSLTPHGT